MKSSQPRVVVVTRPTEYEWLLQRHATRQQAAFFLQTRGQSIEQTAARHAAFAELRKLVLQAIPVDSTPTRRGTKGCWCRIRPRPRRT
ncbi:MAG: hypothetical protein ACYTGX_07850 [Planctomycetota bacterium]|jgi:hypothetical protein